MLRKTPALCFWADENEIAAAVNVGGPALGHQGCRVILGY